MNESVSLNLLQAPVFEIVEEGNYYVVRLQDKCLHTSKGEVTFMECVQEGEFGRKGQLFEIKPPLGKQRKKYPSGDAPPAAIGGPPPSVGGPPASIGGPPPSVGAPPASIGAPPLTITSEPKKPVGPRKRDPDFAFDHSHILYVFLDMLCCRLHPLCFSDLTLFVLWLSWYLLSLSHNQPIFQVIQPRIRRRRMERGFSGMRP